jgi:hypothetical protein
MLNVVFLNIILTKLESVCLMNLREQYILEMLVIVQSDNFIIQCTLQNADTAKRARVCVCVRACVCCIFGHKWEEMTGGETDLHNVELRLNL